MAKEEMIQHKYELLHYAMYHEQKLNEHWDVIRKMTPTKLQTYIDDMKREIASVKADSTITDEELQMKYKMLNIAIEEKWIQKMNKQVDAEQAKIDAETARLQKARLDAEWEVELAARQQRRLEASENVRRLQEQHAREVTEGEERERQKPAIDDFFFVYVSKDVGTHPGVQVDVELPVGNYSNSEFVAALNKLVNETIDTTLVSKHADEGKFVLHHSWFVNFSMTADGKFQFGTIQDMLKISLRFSSEMLYMMGFTKYPTIRWGPLPLSPKQVGLEGLDLRRSSLTALWIFCDIVQRSYVKDITQPLLGVMPIDRVSRQISYESVANMHHKLLCVNHVDRIKIWISENYLGIPLQSTAPTIVTLQFLKNE